MARRKRVRLSRKPIPSIVIRESDGKIDIDVYMYVEKRKIERLAQLFGELKERTYKVRDQQENGKEVNKYDMWNLMSSLRFFLESIGFDYTIADIKKVDVHVLSTMGLLSHNWITGVEFANDNVDLDIFIYEFVNMKKDRTIITRPYQVRVSYTVDKVRLGYNVIMKGKQLKRTFEEHASELLSEYQQEQETPQETPIEAL